MDPSYNIPLFEDTTDDELAWLIANSVEVRLAKGEHFAREGDANPRFYVVLEGELQISRTVDGERMVLGTTPRGIMGGETPLLMGGPMNVDAQAILPSRLMVFDRRAFRGIFASCPTVAAKILRTASERTQGFATLVKQQEKLAALGKLSAGLAHELNNPAAAARRAAARLREVLPPLQSRTLSLCKLGLGAEQIDRLAAFEQALGARRADARPLAAVERADQEDALGEWLDAQGVADGWELAATLVAAGVTPAELATLVAELADDARAEALAWLGESAAADALLGEIGASTGRISELVGAVKSYTYMDQGKLQQVDIHRGLEDTLTLLQRKMAKGVTVVREYDPELPTIAGRGGELNQVWTNLIDNALDAMAGSGELRLITRCESRFVMVEVADSGPGIPAEILPRIFEPFFTTKGVGAGTGLGLDISYRIVRQHGGTIEVQSRPGATRFIVRLPIGAEG